MLSNERIKEAEKNIRSYLSDGFSKEIEKLLIDKKKKDDKGN